ncbi:hypothetical protein FVE85_4235 [Porphyridium purpureum]|uniref:Uncharacterized protein n=1 Tax=Porphyridium purpureum TaxID=35688 RepID=A0A5J4YTK2_PORPP|nr:hypothetical protein FVE85_4235 [Porphyridium purpureum]|eukprot:POR3282..scf229_5
MRGAASANSRHVIARGGWPCWNDAAGVITSIRELSLSACRAMHEPLSDSEVDFSIVAPPPPRRRDKPAPATMRRYEDLTTDELNAKLRLVLSGDVEGANMDHLQMAQVLLRTNAKFDTVTFRSSLLFAKQIPDVDPRGKLRFAIRMLQHAREQNLPLNAHVIIHFLALARPCHKVNVILALKRMMLENQALKLPQMRRTDNRDSGHEDDRPFEQMIGNNPIELTMFDSLLRFLLAHKRTRHAADVWKLLRSSTLLGISAGPVVDASLLGSGVWACAVTHDFNEVEWIAKRYSQLNIVPDVRSLHVLAFVCIRNAQFKAAAAKMQWIIQLGYVLHERELRQYLIEAVKQDKHSRTDSDVKESFYERLALLGDVLIKARDLCTTKRDQLRFLRTYFNVLYDGVTDGRLKAHERNMTSVALGVYRHWRIEDSIVSSYMVYIACCAERFDVALQVARKSHRQIHISRKKKEHGTMRGFAYEALATLSAKVDRIDEALNLVFRPDLDEPVNANRAAFVITTFIYIFGQLGRFDVCRKIFDSFSSVYPHHLAVATAYEMALKRERSLSTLTESVEGTWQWRVEGSTDGIPGFDDLPNK